MLLLQAHFDAPSNERRKLMSAPLNGELKQKHNVSSGRESTADGRAARACAAAWRIRLQGRCFFVAVCPLRRHY
jgi:hypothetical protein